MSDQSKIARRHSIEVYSLHSYPGGFVVSIRPPHPVDGDRSCEITDHGKAIAYARVLRLECGFPITGDVPTNVVSLNKARARRDATPLGAS